jgi:hypothetical protein
MIFNDDDAAPKISMNAKQKVFILGVDVAIIAELCVAMAAASNAPDTFTPTFMKMFFSLFLPTLAIGILGFRKLRDSAGNARS